MCHPHRALSGHCRTPLTRSQVLIPSLVEEGQGEGLVRPLATVAELVSRPSTPHPNPPPQGSKRDIAMASQLTLQPDV